MDNSVHQIAIIGAGLIGKAWALVFARSGCNVSLFDSDSAVRESLPAQLSALAASMRSDSSKSECDEIIAHITIRASLEETVREATYVQECGPELLEFKREVFQQLDTYAAESAVLASSTSALVASGFCDDLSCRERVLVAHPVNPPHLVPLVELCAAPWTRPEIVDQAYELMDAVGQTPIRVNKEIDGFILNRLQAALLNEAMRLVEGGYVSAEDLDKSVSDGLGLRWSFMGPFETIDLNAPEGVCDYVARYSPFFKRIVESQSTTPEWGGDSLEVVSRYCRSELDLGAIAERSQWRDRRLAALQQHRKARNQADRGEAKP